MFELSFCCTCITGELVLWIPDLTSVLQLVGSRTWRDCVVIVEADGFDSKLHILVLVDLLLFDTFSNGLSNLFSCVITRAWHVES